MEAKKEDVLIEILQHQVQCSREEARHFLQKNDYHLLSAIADVQKYKAVNHQDDQKEQLQYQEEFYRVSGRQLKTMVKRLFKQSNLVHLTIFRNQRELLSVPITGVALLYWIYPFLSTLTVLYLLNAEYTIRILKTN